MEIYRIGSRQEAEFLDRLIHRFHDKVPALRYPRIWSLSTIPRVVEQHHDTVVLAAFDDAQQEYLGYVWAQVNPQGEMFVYQAYSATREAGKALYDALVGFAEHRGVPRLDGLVTLAPGEGLTLLGSLRRLHYLATTYGFAPEAVFVSRTTQKGH